MMTKSQKSQKIQSDTSVKPNTRGKYRNRDMDDNQANLYKYFPPDSLLGNPEISEHLFEWVTFFRRNLNRFAEDYLGLSLFDYQSLLLYEMGIKDYNVVIASRAAAKSYLIALYACCRCILYPGSRVVLVSATKNQSKLIVSEKIEKELMPNSPVLSSEIAKIKTNQNEIVVVFHNTSTITVVPASDNARGYRSTCVVREEFRMIDKEIEDSVISPFQITRQAPYMKLKYYENIDCLNEEAVDIYISSSWFDNGHWMWDIVDQAYDDMLKGKSACLFAFDESVVLKHKLKTQNYYQTQKKKQDPATWELEFLNTRLKENMSAFFSSALLEQNRTKRIPFYPRRLPDYLTNRKNPYDIPKQPNEIRIVSCDMAFVENKKNDNSVFTCLRLLPESTTYTNSENNEATMTNGFRRIVSYLEPIQGGETKMQARRILQLYKDFNADYICLDTRNGGVTVYDFLARPFFDEERNVEYPALTCMNDEKFADRIHVEGAEPRIFVVNASQKLNSDIALDFRRVLGEKRIEFLPTLEYALENILPNIREYNAAPDADTQIFFEKPFLETQNLFSETMNLVYEKKPDTGVFVIHEPNAAARKDRYTSCSYGSYMATLLERDLLSQNDDYEFQILIN